jgi:aryl-alcohol dehydrogenase-like predicted oxidoreductase
VVPYSPLARGLLAGTRERDGRAHTARASTAGPDRAADFDVLDAVRDVAARHEITPAAVAMAWLLGRPGVVAPIVGATALRHVDDAIVALDVQLTDADVASLEAPYLPRLTSDYR